MAVIEPKPFGDFLETPFPATRDWIKESILPKRGVMILGGASKSFKSFFSLELCRALTLGDNPFGHPELTVPEPARVLLIEDEIKERGLQARGLEIFKGVNRDYLNEYFFVLSGETDVRLDTNKGFDLLYQAVEQTQPNVLVLDPMGRLIGGIDENRNDQVGIMLAKLDKLLAKYDHNEMSMIMLLHSRKPDTSKDSNFDPLSPHSIRGAGRWFANPDSIMMINKVKTYKNKDGRKAGKLAGRFEVRQGEGFAEDLGFTFNDQSDLRVRYSGQREGVPKVTLVEPPAPKEEQLKFADG